MSKLKVSTIIIGVFCSFLGAMQIATANSIDYNAVDVGALQSQYQSQLKPRTPKKVKTRKPVKRNKINNSELLRYQKLLAAPQSVNKQQAKRPPVRKAVTKPVRQVQKQVTPQRQVQRQQVVQRRVVPKPQAAAPRRDAIFEAASTGNVRLIGQLIRQGVNVNQANGERETALHMASAKGHYSAVIYLLNHGANINARTVNNWLPIHHATRFRHAQIANYLKQKGSPIYAKTSDGMSAVDMARTLNDTRILGIFGIR